MFIVYIMYVDDSNDTPSYTHISLYVVRRVHPRACRNHTTLKQKQLFCVVPIVFQGKVE